MPPSATSISDHHSAEVLSTSDYHATSDSSESKKLLSLGPRRTVTFAPFTDVKEIIPIKSLADVDQIWLIDSDYEEIQNDVYTTIRVMDFGLPLNENNQCRRGLETRTRRGRIARKQLIESARNSVLDEQSLQRHEGIDDPELLADIYFDATFGSQLCAEKIAIQDSKQIFH